MKTWRGIPANDISIVSNNADDRRTGDTNAAAAGGLIGAMTDSGVPEEHAHVYAEGVRRGGTLVTARVEDSLYPEAEAILRQSNWVDPAERGWTRFDETLGPYGPAEIEQERLRYRR